MAEIKILYKWDRSTQYGEFRDSFVFDPPNAQARAQIVAMLPDDTTLTEMKQERVRAWKQALDTPNPTLTREQKIALREELRRQRQEIQDQVTALDTEIGE